MNKHMSLKKMQSGFTLVEIAIVLVIIGLLLGGVLKGTELIENAKVKRAINEINGITTAFYAYQDRYQRLPGDDGPVANVTARGGVWTGIPAGDGNGLIVAATNQTFNPAGEGQTLWQQLKAASFISGDASLTGIPSLPRNAFGGLIGFTSATVGAAPALSGRIVCLSQVPGKSAAAIDAQLDDGNGNTGKIRGIPGNATTNTNPSTAAGPPVYIEATIYTLCSQI